MILSQTTMNAYIGSGEPEVTLVPLALVKITERLGDDWFPFFFFKALTVHWIITKITKIIQLIQLFKNQRCNIKNTQDQPS